ncbi:MAG: hypothetical protein ACFFD2_04305 [Promethearchaeota archaeon]
MKVHMDDFYVYNTIRQIRTYDRYRKLRTFLVVEGKTDSIVYGKFINTDNCKIITANGKLHAIKAIKRLEKEKYDGILTIIDSDFWKLDKKSVESPNILLTDTHDLETMILKSPVFDIILKSYVDEEFLSTSEDLIRKTLLKCSSIIGCLRWVNKQFRLSMDFSRLNFKKFLEKDRLEININTMISEIINISKKKLDFQFVKKKLLTKIKKSPVPWQISQGTDLLNFLLIGLKNYFCSDAVKNYIKTWDFISIQKILLQNYTYKFFCNTSLYESIRKWEQNNTPFEVLATKT